MNSIKNINKYYVFQSIKFLLKYPNINKTLSNSLKTIQNENKKIYN